MSPKLGRRYEPNELPAPDLSGKVDVAIAYCCGHQRANFWPDLPDSTRPRFPNITLRMLLTFWCRIVASARFAVHL